MKEDTHTRRLPEATMIKLSMMNRSQEKHEATETPELRRFHCVSKASKKESVWEWEVLPENETRSFTCCGTV